MVVVVVPAMFGRVHMDMRERSGERAGRYTKRICPASALVETQERRRRQRCCRPSSSSIIPINEIATTITTATKNMRIAATVTTTINNIHAAAHPLDRSQTYLSGPHHIPLRSVAPSTS